jgi:uncharacterized damage-inducible protein DinB
VADLSYPIGKFSFPQSSTAKKRQQWIRDTGATPALLEAAVSGLSETQLDSPYRPGGWTVRQVVHHVPESHMNSYIRFKLALTEDVPVIKPSDEALWAKLPDIAAAPIGASLALLEALHLRWLALLNGMSDSDFNRAFRHPESGLVRLDQNLALYAWHGQHHVAHITSLRERMGW